MANEIPIIVPAAPANVQWPVFRIPREISPLTAIQLNFSGMAVAKPAVSGYRQPTDTELSLYKKYLAVQLNALKDFFRVNADNDLVPDYASTTVPPDTPEEQPPQQPTPDLPTPKLPEPESFPTDPLALIAQLLQSINAFVSSISQALSSITTTFSQIGTNVQESVERLQNSAKNVGAFFMWLDTPQTVERVVVASLGVFLFLIGASVFLVSLFPAEDAAKMALLLASPVP